MGKVTPTKFTVEQFQEQADWIGNLFSGLNIFINDVVINFTNNLTVSDNLYQEIKEIKFQNSAANLPLKFKAKFNAYPKLVYLGYVFNNTLGAYATGLTAAPFIEWSFANGEITISSITGLTASSVYTIRIHVIYG